MRGQRHLLTPITAREFQSAQLVSEGLTNRAIAEKMGIGVETVKAFVYAACQKAGADNRVMLAIWFVRNFPDDKAIQDEIDERGWHRLKLE